MSKNQPELPPGAVDVAGLGAPRQPQVNLLPPEVRAKRSLGRVKAWLAITLLAVLLVSVAGVVLAMFVEKAATDELAAKEAEVVRLQSEKTKYAEVPRVKGLIAATQEALDVTTATEVLWPGLLGSIQATLPENVRILTLSTTLPGPGAPETPSGNPLDPESIGFIGFTGRAAVLPDMAQWMDQLATIPGVTGVSFETADFAADETVYGYDITVTMQVDRTILANQPETEEAE